MALLEVKKYFHYDMRFDQLFLDTLYGNSNKNCITEKTQTLNMNFIKKKIKTIVKESKNSVMVNFFIFALSGNF